MRNDVTYLAIIVGLFALAFALIVVCDRIIGADDGALAEHDGGAAAGTADSLDVAA